MSDSPRFLIAKYIPNTRRMEPRNIGVILWSEGRAAARFLGDNLSRNGTEKYPKFVSRKNYPVYKEWVSYWRTLLAAESIPAIKGRKKIDRNSPEFLDALRSKSKENFVLVEGGVVPMRVQSREVPRIADDLYEEFVDDHSLDDTEASEARLLNRSTKQFLRRTGLQDHPAFNRHYPVQYSFYGVSRHVEFAFGIGGTKDHPSPTPEALIQPTRLLEMKDVNNSLFLFEGITQPQAVSGGPILPKNRCAALIYGATAEDGYAVESKRSLEKVSTVIDLSDIESAIAVSRRFLAELDN